MNSRQKGARGEREWRDVLRAAGIQARRGQQFSGSPDSPDVVSDLDDLVHWEVKRVEALQLYPAMDQAATDAGGKTMPIVAHKKNNKEWVCLLYASDLLKLLQTASVSLRASKQCTNSESQTTAVLMAPVNPDTSPVCASTATAGSSSSTEETPSPIISPVTDETRTLQ